MKLMKNAQTTNKCHQCFLIKPMNNSEVSVLRKALSQYYDRLFYVLKQNPMNIKAIMNDFIANST